MLEKMTKEQVEDIIATYVANPSRATLEALAIKHNRSIRSIAAKLSKEGVYHKERYTTKTGEIPHTKEFLIELLAKSIALDSTQLEGLEKAPKMVIRRLLERFDPEALEVLKP